MATSRPNSIYGLAQASGVAMGGASGAGGSGSRDSYITVDSSAVGEELRSFPGAKPISSSSSSSSSSSRTNSKKKTQIIRGCLLFCVPFFSLLFGGIHSFLWVSLGLSMMGWVFEPLRQEFKPFPFFVSFLMVGALHFISFLLLRHRNALVSYHSLGLASAASNPKVSVVNLAEVGAGGANRLRTGAALHRAEGAGFREGEDGAKSATEALATQIGFVAAETAADRAASLARIPLLPSPNITEVFDKGIDADHDLRVVSIILAAHNEQDYAVRTFDSILEATPPSVLRELILVDDGSDPPMETALPLDWKQKYPMLVILRSDTRKGLIQSKIIGGDAARASVLIFLDCHVKPEPGWLAPILKHINTDYKRVVVPTIPVLDANTWTSNRSAAGTKMMFDWTLQFSWFEDHTDYVPCMSGGLMGMSKKWWEESGRLDGGMSQWGAENIEQSIRIWLCGGSIFVARDSLVGHVFRSKFPYAVDSDAVLRNKVRAVEAWWGPYKEKFYQGYTPSRAVVLNQGELAERAQIRERLQCKTFQWFVYKFSDVFISRKLLAPRDFLIRYGGEQAFLGLVGFHGEFVTASRSTAQQQGSQADDGKKHATLPPPESVYGGSGNGVDLCLTTSSDTASYFKHLQQALPRGDVARRDPSQPTQRSLPPAFHLHPVADRLTLAPCNALEKAQRFAWRNFDKSLYHVNSGKCLDASNPTAPGSEIILYICGSDNHNQIWEYTSPGRQLRHGSFCMDFSEHRNTTTARLGSCVGVWDASRIGQSWNIVDVQENDAALLAPPPGLTPADYAEIVYGGHRKKSAG